MQPNMALAVEVWSHMKAQGVQPTPEEHVDMIKGWAAAGELRQRVADGSVEAFLGQLGDMAFELSPGREAAAASASGEVPGAGGEEGAAQLCFGLANPRRHTRAAFLLLFIRGLHKKQTGGLGSLRIGRCTIPPPPLRYAHHFSMP